MFPYDFQTLNSSIFSVRRMSLSLTVPVPMQLQLFAHENNATNEKLLSLNKLGKCSYKEIQIIIIFTLLETSKKVSTQIKLKVERVGKGRKEATMEIQCCFSRHM